MGPVDRLDPVVVRAAGSGVGIAVGRGSGVNTARDGIGGISVDIVGSPSGAGLPV